MSTCFLPFTGEEDFQKKLCCILLMLHMVYFLLEGQSHDSVLSNTSCPVSAIKKHLVQVASMLILTFIVFLTSLQKFLIA